MNRLSLGQLQPGMVLSLPIFNGTGVMLLPAGTQLTTRHLDQFRHWGVHEAAVDVENGAESQLDPELVRTIDEALDERFAATASDEIMGEIKRIVRKMTIEETIDRRSGPPSEEA